ncbi:sodium channel and clathrin linker 1-like isoform X1 [Vespa mandarinia]|uniref:sodium channel and clathrin linker 1-like isoform X1 n=2 Tax=Vespa mandarinia TaxID=7446 RepID=UPI001616F480|nr:sodium channel and clathrin linker 1-like isoform X1 [Vespa mandarinia]
MIDSELENISKDGNHDKNILLQEYDEVVETLKKDLTMCKTEQNKIRSLLEALQNDSRDTGDLIKDHFSRIHIETCSSESIHNKELIMNLQERLAVLQMEKDSVFQLWQIALKTVTALEDELRCLRTDGKSTKLYEEHIDNVKETYSEAIKALEGKLLQARENFLKQQALWETSKDKIEDLLKEKADITRKHEIYQKDTLEKDRNNMRIVETLKTELAAAKADTQRAMDLKGELESKLNEAMKFTASLIARNEETKNKMSEALELVEIAVREKDLVLQREAHVLEEKGRLEVRLSKITEEHTVMLQDEITKMKDGYERSGKKYISEIKELKAELKQRTMLLDNAQKDYRVSQEELEKVRQNSEDVLQKSRTKILDFEQKLHCVERQLRDNDDTQRKRYDAEIRHLESKVIELEEKLSAANDELRKMQQENRDSMEHQVKQANEKTKNLIEQCNDLEKRLARSLEDRDNFQTEIKRLQMTCDREMQKREYERHSLENKIHDLEINFQKATYLAQDGPYANVLATQVYTMERETKKPSSPVTIETKEHCCRPVLLEQMNKAQERYDRKMKELSHHVEVHRKLSRKWKEEAKSMTTKFQEKSKEHRAKINALRKENEELNKRLFSCQQELTKHKVQSVPRCSEENKVR